MVVNIRAVRKDGVVARVEFAATDQELIWIELAYSLRMEGNIGLSGCCSKNKLGRTGEGQKIKPPFSA
jgi:hypothetical protein